MESIGRYENFKRAVRDTLELYRLQFANRKKEEEIDARERNTPITIMTNHGKETINLGNLHFAMCNADGNKEFCLCRECCDNMPSYYGIGDIPIGGTTYLSGIFGTETPIDNSFDVRTFISYETLRRRKFIIDESFVKEELNKIEKTSVLQK